MQQHGLTMPHSELHAMTWQGSSGILPASPAGGQGLPTGSLPAAGATATGRPSTAGAAATCTHMGCPGRVCCRVGPSCPGSGAGGAAGGGGSAMTGLQHTKDRLSSSTADTDSRQATERWEGQWRDKSAAHKAKAKQREACRTQGRGCAAALQVWASSSAASGLSSSASGACSTQGEAEAAALWVQADDRHAIWLSSSTVRGWVWVPTNGRPAEKATILGACPAAGRHQICENSVLLGSTPCGVGVRQGREYNAAHSSWWKTGTVQRLIQTQSLLPAGAKPKTVAAGAK